MESNTPQQEIGIVKSIHGFLVFLEGLPSVRINDVVESETGAKGLVSALLPDSVVVYMLSPALLRPGQIFTKARENITIAVGDYLLGRTINPLGDPIDGKKLLTIGGTMHSLEKKAEGIYARQFIHNQFITGLTLIDMLVPMGRGQRQFILGDARSGKTSFLVDLIVNQKDTGVICIYASIGKAITDVKKLVDVLDANKASKHTIVVAASSSDPPPLIFLTPKTALTIAEYFQAKGRDVLVILDDLGNHAKIYREMSLLEERSPGRDSYPGDIFYQHAHLLERAGNFKKEFGGGSITALPVMEINLTDFTGFIPTNIMAMTDGHVLFTSSLHNQGMRPAIDVSLSVTRVGLQTQNRVQNAIAQRVKTALAQAIQLESISRLSSELPSETQELLHQKDLIEELITQESFIYYSAQAQMLSLALVFTSMLKEKDKYFLRLYKKQLMEAFMTHPKLASLRELIAKTEKDQEVLDALEGARGILDEICSVSPK